MQSSCTNLSRPDRPRDGHTNPSVGLLAAIAIVMAVVLSGGVYYRFHLLWWMWASRSGLQEVRQIPDRPLPEAQVPRDWLRCRVGCLEFSLPPDLAGHSVSPPANAAFVMFQHGSRSVEVLIPTNACEHAGLLEAASALSPEPRRFTLPALRRACFEASADDFRWSMSPKEIRWHTFRVASSQLLGSSFAKQTESITRDGVDGIVLFDENLAVFDWQSTESEWNGYVRFRDRDEASDMHWVREVVGSLRVLKESEGDRSQVPATLPRE